MPITRATATSLLNQREMALFDDSRANALRKLDGKALQARIARARDGRDRARDLVQRQKLGSRAATGSKRGTSGVANARSQEKAEAMADILARFQQQLAKCQPSAAPAKTASTPASTPTAPKEKAARTAPARRAAKPASTADTAANRASTMATAKPARKKPARTVSRAAANRNNPA